MGAAPTPATSAGVFDYPMNSDDLNQQLTVLLRRLDDEEKILRRLLALNLAQAASE